MNDPLALSARYIDDNVYEGPASVHRVTTLLSEVAEGVGFIEAFSNVVLLDSGDGLVVFDTSLELFQHAIIASLRGWSSAPVHTIGLTHGHVDHIGGTKHLLAEAEARGDARPHIVGHAGIAARFERYARTNGYNGVINKRQFAAFGGDMLGAGTDQRWGPSEWVAPDTSFTDTLDLQVGALTLKLHHARGETDDHLWAWVPERKAIIAGDFVTWVFPNAGNPQKVQRYPAEWAAALRAMADCGAELLLPAHGLPVAGAARIKTMLLDIAQALETLVEQTLARMNAGETLDDCIHGVTVPDELLQRPYLRAIYDEPEFVVRNIWRLYGGWYDGNPARLKPARDAHLAREIAALSGGPDKLAARAAALADSDLRLACQLIELAAQAAPDDGAIHAGRAAIYRQRRDAELSLMARGVYASAAQQSQQIAGADKSDTSNEA